MDTPEDLKATRRRLRAEQSAAWFAAHRDRRRQWIETARNLHPAPVLTTQKICGLIAVAADVSIDRATVIYDVIIKTLAVALRNRQKVTLPNFGTFTRRKAQVGWKLKFKPQGDWWGWWMPVVAYNNNLEIVGIWDGPEILLFGHPDNPYAEASEVPFAPDWSWRSATPLPGEPPAAPYPHPVRSADRVRNPMNLNFHRDQRAKARRERTTL